MYTNLQTFGEFLIYIMKKKKITISQLAALTNTKSRNSILRLIRDECSIEVIESFKCKLINISPNWLSTKELTMLDKSIVVSHFGKDIISSRSILLNLCTKTMGSSSIKINKIFNTDSDNPQTLTELFDSYRSYAKIYILIFDLPVKEISDILASFVLNASCEEINIQHVINIKDNAAINAIMFASIYRLINYRYYSAYYRYTNSNSGFEEYLNSDATNLIIINKVSFDGIHSTDFVKLNQGKSFSMLYNNPGDDIYNLYLEDFTSQKSSYLPIRRIYINNNPLEKLINICDFLLHLEKTSAEYLIKQNMCFQMIHTDILYKMLVDSDFLGLSENHPKIQKLMQIAIDRFNNYFKINKMKINLFTRRGLEDFVINHNLSDHFYQFRDFTTAEVKFTLEFILQQVKTNPYFKIYILKEDYRFDNIEFTYYENQVVYFFDSCSGYDENLDEGIITAKPFLMIFDDFIKNELIPNHTYPESETIYLLENLITTLE